MQVQIVGLENYEEESGVVCEGTSKMVFKERTPVCGNIWDSAQWTH